MDADRELNRKAWDVWAGLHPGTAAYDVEAFKAGANTLLPIEREALGDVLGKSLLHLQCHFGMDTLSWARLGARVTGIDFSPKAIELARGLTAEIGVEARFVCSTIEDLPDNLSGQFDIVFTSYGVLCWLPDLRRWAQVIAHFLKPGGTFLIVEGHPTAHLFENEGDLSEWRLAYPYFAERGPLRYTSYGSYAAAAPEMEMVEWPHGLGEIVTSLVDAGLTIRRLGEYPFSFHECSSLVEKHEDGFWWPKDGKVDVPLMFALLAAKGTRGSRGVGSDDDGPQRKGQ